MRTEEFYPDWFEGTIPPDSFRSIFKWGDPNRFKHPNRRLYQLIKERFGMKDDDFKTTQGLGLETAALDIPLKIAAKHIQHFQAVVGAENVKTDSYTRIKAAYGKSTLDALRLRRAMVENLPDLVLWPGTKEQIMAIIGYCHRERIPLYVYGGGSSVTRGTEAVRGGVTMDTHIHFRKILSFNETNQTITVQPGISGPDLESALNNAQSYLGAQRNYTCGHFPQSFQYSTVGGWVVTRGAGQNSSYYGKIEDMVLCQEYATPQGSIKTAPYPAKATGPDLDQLMMGSEGCFGVLVSVTLKVRRFMPEHTKRFSYMFKEWDAARNALREIMQSEGGLPSACRLSDPEETDIALKLYGLEATILDRWMAVKGYKKGKRALFLGSADGSRAYTSMVKKNVHRIARKYGALYTTGYVTKQWEKGRFKDPYLREDLADYGIITDTLECAVNWDNLPQVYDTVRSSCKQRPKTICMTHISHCYPQGCNLYFIFMGRFAGLAEFTRFHGGVLDAIQASGAAMSHHHGIGKLFAPWLEGQLGKNELAALKALKKHFDPHNILNPGGTLALDLPDSQKRFSALREPGADYPKNGSGAP